MSRVSLRLAVGALLAVSLTAPLSARASSSDVVFPWSGSQPVALAVEGGHISAVQDSGSGRTVTTLDADLASSSPVWSTTDARPVSTRTGRVVTDGTVTAWSDLSDSNDRATAWTWRGPDGTTYTHPQDASGYGAVTAVSGRWLLLGDHTVVDASHPSAPAVMTYQYGVLGLQHGVAYIPGGVLGAKYPAAVVRKDLETGASDRIEVPGCYYAGSVRVAGSWLLVGCSGDTYLVDLSGQRATRRLPSYEQLGNGFLFRANGSSDGKIYLSYAPLTAGYPSWFDIATMTPTAAHPFDPYAFSRGPVPTVAWFDATGVGHLTRLPVETSPLPAHPTGRYLGEAPSNLTAVAWDSGSEISWSLPLGVDASTVTGFVFRGNGVDRQLPADQRHYDVFSMQNGVRREFSVAAVTDKGEGSQASISTTPATRPQAPVAVTATPGDGSAQVRWTAPADDGGAPITNYTVQASSATELYTGTTRLPITADGASHSATIRGLENGTAYAIKVWAHNAQGQSYTAGGVDGVVPRPDPVQEPPRSVRITTGNRSVTVSWQPPAHDGGGLASYVVSLSNGMSRTVGPAVRSVTFSSLVNGVAVTARVQAVGALGVSPAATTAAAAPATIPNVMRAPRAVGARHSAVLSWTRPATNGAPLTVYEVQDSRGAARLIGGKATRATISPLWHGTLKFRIRAKNRAGAARFSAWSNPVRIR